MQSGAALLEVYVERGVASVVLDRPPVNALDAEHVSALASAVDRLASDDEVRAVVVRATGTRFCAGADINLLKEWTSNSNGAEAQEAFSSAMQRTFSRLAALPVPTIAAVSGAATGGGLELALACDLRVVGVGAKIGLTEIRLGLVPGAGGTQRLTALVGRSVALRLLLRGELVTGEAAATIGLAEFCVPDDEVDERALELAVEVAQWPRSALVAVKECVRATDVDGYLLESHHTRLLNRQPETAELVRAFFSTR